jgi:hypothetical protein
LDKINLKITFRLAEPISEKDIQALKEGTFYSFANKKSNLKRLTLGFEDTNYFDELGQYPEKFEKLEGLLAAMAKTPIKQSLEVLHVDYYKMNKKQVKEMAKKHGFTNVKNIICF